MPADPEREPRQGDRDQRERRGWQAALDDALKNIFSASEPVSERN